MKKHLITVVTLASALASLAEPNREAESEGEGVDLKAPRTFTIKADRIAVDNVTKAAVATGHVEAVSEPVYMHSESATRNAEGVTHFADPTTITTCTNHNGVCHWSLQGDVEYLDGKYIKGRNIWLNFYEMPVFWIPYFYYPLEGECALRIMPGYTSRWGAYLMMKYVYEIAGDPAHDEGKFWMYGNTRLDLRYVNGIAVGQSVDWNLGPMGRGHFKIYYAWDEDYDTYNNEWSDSRHNYQNWGSMVNRDRYIMELEHRWEPTERDIVRLKGSIASDTYFRGDFFRNDFFSIANDWTGGEGNELAWEHNEDILGLGVSLSGPLNDFYGGVARLPEVYADVAPMPIWGPFVYETENRIGYLSRSAAEYGNGDRNNAYAFNPGPWADYGAFRFDSYHRVTAPMKFWDVLSFVPRLAYRGTYWNESGDMDLTGWNYASNAGQVYRSVLEAGGTFSARGKAWLSDSVRHLFEPYFDVLAQKAWYGGVSEGNRSYVFDSLDASVDWQDQFAGRSRNLPYTYYGVTPGLRNAFERLDSHGWLRTVFDVDAYMALQFNHADWYGDDDYHKLAAVGGPNYGKHDIYAAPGLRLRWFPAKDIVLRAQAEYDPDYNRLAMADLEWRHLVTRNFSYYLRYSARNYRRWDFSSTPYDPDTMSSDDFNWARFDYLEAGFTNHPIDWFAWSPFIRWDCRAGELDRVGTWLDYLTDCLGFRLILEYQNEYTRIDGSRHDDDFHVGFYIYLRALGADNANIFNQ